MTVNELIEQLQQFDPALPILVEGYETGWDSILKLRLVNVIRCQKPQEWDGEYRESGKGKQIEYAALLIIGRRGRFR